MTDPDKSDGFKSDTDAPRNPKLHSLLLNVEEKIEMLQSTLDGNSRQALADQVEAFLDLIEEIEALREDLKDEKEDSDEDRDPGLLDRDEAADWLGVSTRTLDDLEEAGRISSIRIGRRVLYHPETLQAFVRAEARGGEE